MKLKKLVLAVFLVAALVGLTGCDGLTGKAPQVTKIEFRDKNGVLLEQYDDCSTDVDPKKVYFIDFKFNIDMDTNHGGFTYWGEGKQNDIWGDYWVNSKTYRLYVVLTYDTYYRYGVSTDNPTENDFYRFYSEGGKLLNFSDVEFSTIKYSRTTPKTFEINKYDSFITRFQDNNENNPKTQQCVFRLDSVLDHEMLIKGDTVKFTYKVKCPVNIKKIRANIVDNSVAANYWKDLTPTATKDVIIAENEVASTDENENWIENTVTFTIEEDAIAYNSVQLWDVYDKDNIDDKLYVLEFAEMK